MAGCTNSDKLLVDSNSKASYGRTLHNISRNILFVHLVAFLIISGHLYVESQKKPDDMPQRWKATMIDRMILMVLQTAEMCESVGLAHHLNVTRGFFEGATSLLYLMENSPITQAVTYTVSLVTRLIEKVGLCDALHLGFYRPATDQHLSTGDDVISEDDIFDGVSVRLYRPHMEPTPTPAIVYVHGAVVMGTVDVWDSMMRMYAASTHAVIVYVEYRLAPEYGFPAPLDDCLTVTRWVLRNAERYHIDPKSVAIQGDSAGAVIASVIAQTIATEHDDNTDNPELKMLILMMPLLQGLDLNLPSFHSNERQFSGVLSRVLVAKFWIWYAGLDGDDLVTAILQGRHLSEEFRRSDRFQNIIGHDLLSDSFRHDTLKQNGNWTGPEDTNIAEKLSPLFLNPKFSPLMEENISPHHPHTLIITGGLDILRDDGIIYTNRLRRAGVKVWWRHFEKGFHSCVAYWQGMLKMEIGHQILKETVDSVRSYLHEPTD